MESLEKRLPPLKKLIVLGFFALIQLMPAVFPENHASADILIAPSRLRVSIWTPIDEYPLRKDLPGEDEEFYMPAIRNLRNIGAFYLTGMCYGWTFSYTPADRARGVSEYFECIPRSIIEENDSRMLWTDPVFSDNRITCWLEFERSSSMMANREMWHKMWYVSASSRGEGSVHDGPEGMKNSVLDAVRNAVRDYAMAMSKNKPKEVTGTIVLKDENPRIFIDSGKYVADLDFFLYVDKIEQYKFY